MDEKILEILKAQPNQTYTLHELLAKAEIPERKEKEAKRVLKALIRRGEVEKDPGRRYRASSAGLFVEGFIEAEAHGRVFVPEGPRKKVTPVALLPDDSSGAEPGDRVLAEMVVRGHRPQHYARIKEILERPKQHFVGVFRRVGQACFAEIDAPAAGFRAVRGRGGAVLIDPEHTGGAEDGQLIEVLIVHPGIEGHRGAMAHVEKVLGTPGERSTEMAKIILENHLDVPFPPEVETEAASFGSLPTEADMAGRRDLRNIPLVTIDGETAKDFDDAVAAVRLDDNRYKLFVAIADVTHYVRYGTPLDEEAYRRGTSTYLTDRAIPMLPETLSNGLCSLNPHVDRLCMVAEIVVDRNGKVLDTDFARGVMRSRARLTYTRVAKALEGEPDEECQSVLPTLLLLSRIASKLLERRLRRGAIDLDLPEPEITFGEDGNPTDVRRRPRNDAHRLIEDLMLAANEAVAAFFVDRKLPSVFRVHENPDPDRLATFAALCSHLGLRANLPDAPSPGEVALLLEKVTAHPNGKALHGLLLRSLAQARYDAECKGHYGLASDHYLHFTSPIRRYPDLVVHRLLKQTLDEKPARYSLGALQEISQKSSEAERRAMLAERASLELDRALVAQKYVGETMDAAITGVAGFGLFAAGIAPFIEGMIPVQKLPSDYYELDEYGAMLVGQQTGRTFMLGQAVQVRVASVNLTRRQVEMELAEMEPSTSDGGRTGDGPRRGRRPRGAGGAPSPGGRAPTTGRRGGGGRQKPRGASPPKKGKGAAPRSGGAKKPKGGGAAKSGGRGRGGR